MSELREGDGAEDELAALLKEHQQAASEGRHQDVNVLSMRLLALAGERANEQALSPISLLKREAQHCEAKADWEGTEAAYHQALVLAEKEDHLGAQFDIHSKLSSLHRLLGQDERAFQEAQLATHVARCLDSRAMLGIALAAQAARALTEVAAHEAISESLELLESRKDPPGDLPRAQALIARANCYITEENISSAEADLEAAWQILQPKFGALFLAGVHVDLARWWGATARLRTRRNDLSGAANAWREVVGRLRHVVSLPQISGPHHKAALADSLRGLSQALSANGEVVEAEAASTESQAIRSELGLPLL